MPILFVAPCPWCHPDPDKPIKLAFAARGIGLCIVCTSPSSVDLTDNTLIRATEHCAEQQLSSKEWELYRRTVNKLRGMSNSEREDMIKNLQKYTKDQ